MTTAYRISCAKCKQIVESLETALCSGLTTILGVTSQWRAREIVCWKSELSLHAIILSWQVYYVESELWCHITQKNQKIVRTPHILGRLNTCANNVYQALLHFSHTPEMRLTQPTNLYPQLPKTCLIFFIHVAKRILGSNSRTMSSGLLHLGSFHLYHVAIPRYYLSMTSWFTV